LKWFLFGWMNYSLRIKNTNINSKIQGKCFFICVLSGGAGSLTGDDYRRDGRPLPAADSGRLGRIALHPVEIMYKALV